MIYTVVNVIDECSMCDILHFDNIHEFITHFSEEYLENNKQIQYANIDNNIQLANNNLQLILFNTSRRDNGILRDFIFKHTTDYIAN